MQQNDELFSALLDGELSADEIDTLLVALDEGAGGAEVTARWGAIGASMRGQRASATSILEGVRAVTDAEPHQPRVADFAAAKARRRMPAQWKLPATGLAAAASLALAVVLLPSAIEERGPITPAADATGGAALAQSETAPAPLERRQEAREVALPPQLAAGRAAAGEREEMLNTYFIEYAGYRTAQGIGGPLGYARYAAHNADMRSAQPR